jgi:peptidoglycan hydrolase-like protein with peptidoglycan-binding domain
MSVFTDVSEVPVDEYDPDNFPDLGDENQSELTLEEYHQKLGIALNQGTLTKHFVIPFERTIQYGDKGRDVIGAKRAIWRANGLPVPANATQLFGKGARDQLKIFQKTKKLNPDGVLGPVTLKALAYYFDSRAYFFYVGYPPGSTPAKQIVAYCWWGYNNRGSIGYFQYRPMNYMTDLEHLPENEDCSTFVTKAYKFGGAKDPNRMSPPYNGYGNTGTLRQHGTIVSVYQCIPADLAHYDNPQHVGVVVVGGNGGNDAKVIELGSSPGPLYLGINYRQLTYVMRYEL